MGHRLLLVNVAVVAYWFFLGSTSSAVADESSAANPGVQTYPRAYFSPFNPQTARDMIDRLPGFRFDPGTDIRGFGGGAGNVLIDGARPSSKSGGLEEALARLSAGIVAGIEVIRGSAGASESAGQSVVANIITQRIDAATRWGLVLERAAHGKFNSALDLVHTAEVGAWNTSSQFQAALKRRPLQGTRLSLDAGGTVTFAALESSPSDARKIGFSSQARRSTRAGVLTLNARVNHAPSTSNTKRIGFDGQTFSSVPDQRQAIDVDRERFNTELGVDWAQDGSRDWVLKWLSLSSYNDFESLSLNALERPVGDSVSNSVFDNRQKTFESILRTTIGRSGEHQLSPEFGAEVAYNRLSSELALQFEDATGVTNIELPAGNVVVEELRGEVFANLRWKRSRTLTVEAGIGAEASRISVSGDVDNSDTFFFAKPFATLIYDVRSDVQIRLDARRSVGQLDFTDFAASASVVDDRLLGGNPELGPDQTTRLSASIDLRSGNLGALNVEAFHEWRDDVLEQILLPSGSPGLGNAGSARVWGLRTTASVTMSSLLPGGLLELEGTFFDSTFEDPIIGAQRSVSSIDSADVLIEFRQDLAERRLSWGVSYRPPLEGPFYFVDEISTNRDGRYWSAFFETTQFSKFKIRMDLDGIGKQNFFRERRLFEPDRSGLFLGSEVISRNRGMFLALTLSGQF